MIKHRNVYKALLPLLPQVQKILLIDMYGYGILSLDQTQQLYNLFQLKEV